MTFQSIDGRFPARGSLPAAVLINAGVAGDGEDPGQVGIAGAITLPCAVDTEPAVLKQIVDEARAAVRA
jgi:hypothetical protein